ncbi:hypothetical protein B0H10DRAFT_2109334 [Mycena sp. CBHHK59/15]|nr:hypothetical protein B0H10DRAFT_2109334 [Mycena sp. CBHHK59/15]
MRIPDAVALNSRENPDGPLYIYAKEDSCGETVTITNFEFGRAAHRAAQLLRPNREGSDGHVVALIALSDTILYQAILPFPISPRNSPAAIVNLLRKTSCHRLVATCVTLDSLLAAVKQEITQSNADFPITIEEAPSLFQIYPNLGSETSDCAFEPYADDASCPSLDGICMYLHSSGSTGFPKAIPETHRALMQWTTLAPFLEMRDCISHPFAAMPLPSFHMGGIYAQLLQPVYGRIAVAVYPPTAISPEALPVLPSPDNILEHAHKNGCKAMIILPSLLAVWSNSPDAVTYLKTLHFVICSGGSLPQRLGDALVDAGVNLRTLYGTTEFGAISAIIPGAGDEQDWAWMHFPDEVKLRWVSQGDGTFECQVLTSEKHTISVENLDDVKGYATSDLWVNHPEKRHLWRIVGRIDDVLVHTSGEKTVPVPMEDIVMGSPHVVGTVMFGHEREQTGILIELVPELQIDVQNATQVAELRNKIWPIIEDANKIAPAFSRIFKEMILFTSPDKPLPRTGKRTVMRKAALNVYTKEIEALYDGVAGETSTNDSIKQPAAWDAKSIRQWLIVLTADVSNFPTISPQVDLFHQGFDSLSATFLRLRILSALRSSNDTAVQRAADGVTQNLVYSYPTIVRLSAFLYGLVSGDVNARTDPNEMLEVMISKYASGFAQPAAFTGNPQVVLLTGSTGSLGSQILASLLGDCRVVKVYALNRPSSASEKLNLAHRHRNIFNKRGLDTALLDSSKLVLVEGQTDQADLGLETDLYNELKNCITLVIHNAWKLDFNMSLPSFEPHILGTRHLLDLALSSPRSPKFLFTSSIASVLSWDSINGSCPEEILTDASVTSVTGYGQSKFVAEQIIAKSGLSASCLRIGQICGALPKGVWATSDWLPILIKTGIALGKLPLADGLVSWIDFETVVQAIVDVAFTPQTDLSPVYNLVHPRPVSWKFVMTSFRDAIFKQKNGSQLQLSCATDGNPSTQDMNLPGIKLLDLFSHMSKNSIGAALSAAVRDTVEAWVRYWSASGFI